MSKTRRLAGVVRVVFLVLILLSLPLLGASECASAKLGSGCCKTCTKGKACGNTCIAAWKTCHVGPGCACNSKSASLESGTLVPTWISTESNIDSNDSSAEF